MFAPAFETGGHDHHNIIAEIATRTFSGRLTAYLTYTHEARSGNGQLVPFESEWIELKFGRSSATGARSSSDRRATTSQYEYYA